MRRQPSAVPLGLPRPPSRVMVEQGFTLLREPIRMLGLRKQWALAPFALAGKVWPRRGALPSRAEGRVQ